MDIYQGDYTPADLVLMAKEVQTLEWDRTCRIVEMIHNTQCSKPMRHNAMHPYRSTGERPRSQDLKIVSAGEFVAEMKGGKHGNSNSGVGTDRGTTRLREG